VGPLLTSWRVDTGRFRRRDQRTPASTIKATAPPPATMTRVIELLPSEGDDDDACSGGGGTGAGTMTTAITGAVGVAAKLAPMKTPLDSEAEIALVIALAAACATSSVGVVMMAVTVMEPDEMESETSAALTPAVAARSAL